MSRRPGGIADRCQSETVTSDLWLSDRWLKKWLQQLGAEPQAANSSRRSCSARGKTPCPGPGGQDFVLWALAAAAGWQKGPDWANHGQQAGVSAEMGRCGRELYACGCWLWQKSGTLPCSAVILVWEAVPEPCCLCACLRGFS